MEDLELIHKKEETIIEIEDNEAENIEIENIPRTQEEINEDLIRNLEINGELLSHKLYEMTKENQEYENEIQWYKRYMVEHGIDFERWKEDIIRRERAEYEKYGAMRPEDRIIFDDKLERVREAMRRRRAQK